MIETIGRLPGLFEKLALLRNWNGEGEVAQIVSSSNMKKYHRRDGTLVHKVLDNPCPCEKYTGVEQIFVVGSFGIDGKCGKRLTGHGLSNTL